MMTKFKRLKMQDLISSDKKIKNRMNNFKLLKTVEDTRKWKIKPDLLTLA